MAPSVIYDPETHTSRTPEGILVPHVTAVLGETVAVDFESLKDLGPKAREAIEFARDRGTAVHADCHAYDDNDLDWSTVDPRIEPYVLVWAECRRSLGLVPIAHARERHLYHDLYGYCGIMDGMFLRESDGKRILADLKTGDPTSAACDLQTAAYEAAWVRGGGEPPDERWGIWLQPGRRVPYRVFNYSNDPLNTHFQIFLACLTVYTERRRRRRIA